MAGWELDRWVPAVALNQVHVCHMRLLVNMTIAKGIHMIRQISF